MDGIKISINIKRATWTPNVWLKDALTCLPDHKAKNLDDFLPKNWKPLE